MQLITDDAKIGHKEKLVCVRFAYCKSLTCFFLKRKSLLNYLEFFCTEYLYSFFPFIYSFIFIISMNYLFYTLSYNLVKSNYSYVCSNCSSQLWQLRTLSVPFWAPLKYISATCVCVCALFYLLALQDGPVSSCTLPTNLKQAFLQGSLIPLIEERY